MPVGVDWNSLKDKWRQQVEKPKNLGLKTQPTGITDALGRVAAAEGRYLTKDTQSVDHLLEALHQLIVRSKAAIDKHKSVYSEACTFLEKVHTVATKRHIEVANQKKITNATANR